MYLTRKGASVACKREEEEEGRKEGGQVGDAHGTRGSNGFRVTWLSQ